MPAQDAAASLSADEKKAAKKAEENRKKREKAKAKKKAEKESPTAGDVICRAERRDAGPGCGQGMFATSDIKEGDTVVCARPALSVVFDPFATKVCGFCFASVGGAGAVAKAAGACAVEVSNLIVRVKPNDAGSCGLMLENDKATGHAVFRGYAKGSVNVDATAAASVSIASGKEEPSPSGGGGAAPSSSSFLAPGDLVVAVEGVSKKGNVEVVTALRAAAAAAGGGGDSGSNVTPTSIALTITRPAITPCQGCNRFAICSSCAGTLSDASTPCVAPPRPPVPAGDFQAVAVATSVVGEGLAGQGEEGSAFEGSKPGWAFFNGPNGVGYYRDENGTQLGYLQSSTPGGPPRERLLSLPEWHSGSGECSAFVKRVPAGAKSGGDTSIVRMLIRHKATTDMAPSSSSGSGSGSPGAVGRRGDSGEWCPPGAAKEGMSLLDTLQGNPVRVGGEQGEVMAKSVGQLCDMTGVPAKTVEGVIYAIRCNAAEITRPVSAADVAGLEPGPGGSYPTAGGGNVIAKVGCALSCYMGYTNHDCDPNSEAQVDGAGLVRLEAVKGISCGGEVTICYCDRAADYKERRAVLADHYGFDCKCARCKEEARSELKAKARAGNKGQGQGIPRAN